MAKPKYDWKKTVMKGIEIFVYGGIGAIISYLGNMPQTETIVFCIALLKMLRNYIKHR